VIELPSDALVRTATLESSNGMARFTAPVNAQYIPKSSADGYMLVSIQVFSCKKGVFGCAVTGRDEKVQPVVIKEITPSSALAIHTFNISPGRKYWVKYWVNMANSPWYTNNLILGPT